MSKTTELLKQTLGHFCVDAACAAIVIHGTEKFIDIITFFVFYNFCAFCLQPLAGLIFDKYKKLKYQSYIIIDFVLLLFGFIPIFNIWIRILCAGLGNCLFHVGAGTLILNSEKYKMSPLGIFVSSGAVGLFLGTIFADIDLFRRILALCLITLIALNVHLPTRLKVINKKPTHWGIVALLCLCIVIRSFMGFMPLTQFEKSPLILFTITMGVFFGKYLGGILCDKFGIRKIIVISTIIVASLFLFSFTNPYLWTLVQMIINLSMPITLYLMYRAMPRYPGFSFGLAASFLVVGLLMTFVVSNINIPSYYFILLFIINSVIILLTDKRLR